MKRPGPVAFAIVGCLIAAGFLAWVVKHETPGQRTYRIGWENDPPEMLRGGNGEPTGFAVELVREAARRRGIRLEWVYRDESSEVSLRSGKVDLEPLMVITPERTRVVHISAPYLESAHDLLVRGDSAARQLNDVSGARIGYSGMPINLAFLQHSLPNAQYIVRPSSDLIRSLCEKEIDAAFIEEHTAITMYLKGGACSEPPRIVPVNAPEWQLGVGATFGAAAAADAIRDEIGAMTAEGKLRPLLAKWGFLTGRSEESIETLLNARRRERRLLALVGLIVGLLVLAILQTLRARRSELRVRGSERRFRELFENVRLHGAMWDRNGIITFVNRFWLEVTGWPREEVVGNNMLRFFDPGHHEQISEALARINRGEPSVFLEAPVFTKDGNTRWVQWTGTPLRDTGGNTIGMANLGIDVTEHRVLQEQYLQAQKLESIGRLAGGVAHDFNNLLMVILGYGRMLLKRLGPTDPSRDDISEILTAGERATSLVRQLLAFSRKQVTRPRPFDLNLLLAESEAMLRRLLGEQIEIITILSTPAACVMADPDQIHQVVMNLVVNARDAMPGGGTITIRTASLETQRPQGAGLPGAYVVLSVSDTGIGMDENTRAHLFEPFFTTKAKGVGTGLGLATVYGIVKESQGWIDVESALGKGSTFRVYLPKCNPLVQAGVKTEPDKSQHAGSGTILIAEDQPEVRALVQRALESCGYRVLTAASGREALAAAERFSGPIHLLLTDMVMPGMSGSELARELAVSRPGIPVIYTSGYAEELAAQNGAANLGTSFLPKPFTAEALAAKVRELTEPH